jgi:hypothetical protein
MGILKISKVNVFLIVLTIAAILLAGCGFKSAHPPNQSTQTAIDASFSAINGASNKFVWQVDEWVYYMNIRDYGLYRMKTDGSGRQKLNDDESWFIDVAGDWVYYSNDSDEGKLYRMKTDGSGRQRLGDDRCIEVDAAGDWIYYVIEGYRIADARLYRVKVDGSGR